MKQPRYALPKDGNHSDLRWAWLSIGGSWLDLVPHEPGTPDALLGFRREDQLVEIKIPGKDPRPEQVAWHRRWRGRPVAVVRTAKDLETLARGMGR